MTAKRLTKRQRRALRDYIAELQANLRLQGWVIDVERDPSPAPHDKARACTWITSEAHEATIYVNPVVFPALTRVEQRQVVVHELCHLILEQMDQAVRTGFRPRGRGDGAAAVKELARLAMEKANDDFAWIIAEHQPLPARGWLS